MDIDLTCGFETGKQYKLSSLLCSVVRKAKLSMVFDKDNPLTCDGLSEKMATNIIRVAAKRIFSDPNRSFIEPISNSIDSYRSIRGVKSIGKFGMGFFSLLFWLDAPGSKLIVSSCDGVCSWDMEITMEDGEYYFNITDSKVLQKKSHGGTQPTRKTTVVLTGIDFDVVQVSDLLERTFRFVENVIIDMYIPGCRSRSGAINGQYYGKNRDRITIKLHNKEFTVTDYATGIPFKSMFDKLLVPSISTKTLSGFLSSDAGSYNKSRVVYPYRGFLSLTIGDVAIYTYKAERIDPLAMSKSLVLSLPAEFPMPVSRDDIILETDEHREILYRSLLELFEDVIQENVAVDFMMKCIYGYSSYANDPRVDGVITKFVSHIRNLPNIIFGPNIHAAIYPYITDFDGIKIVPSSIPDFGKLNKYLLGRYETLDNIFKFVKVIKVNLGSRGNMVRITPDILLVHTEFTKDPQWVAKLIISSDSILHPSEGGQISDENMMKYSKISSAISRDRDMSIGYGNVNIGTRYINVLSFILTKCRHFIDVIIPFSNTYDVKASDKLSVEGGAYASVLSFIVEVACEFYTITGEYEPILNLLYYYFSQALTLSFGSSSVATFMFERLTVRHYRDLYKFKHDFLLDGANLVTRKIRFPPYKERLLYYYQMVINSSLANEQNLLIIDPVMYSIFNIPVFVKRIDLVYNIIKDYDPIYDIYISTVFMKRFSDEPYNRKEPHTQQLKMDEDQYVSDRIKFLYKELSTKRGTRVLEDAYFKMFEENIIDSMVMIVTDTYNSLLIYDNMMEQHMVLLNRGPDYENLPIYCFTGSQLTQGIFMNYVDTTNFNWLIDIPKLKGDIPLQALEIVINEGTSKPYVESILTELIQNSIDASLSLDNPKIDVLVTEEGITVADDVGIPIEGLVSLMTPFLSSKGATSLTTGEMGSGFMNVFRRPWTEYVRVTTKDPNSGYGYILYGYPKVSGDRVIDVKYEMAIVEDYKMKGTEIFVAFQEESEDIPSLVTSGLMYSNIYLGSVKPSVYVNTSLLSRDIILLESNQIADIYIDSDHHTTMPTIILTNGVPHSVFYSRIDDDHTLQRGSTGLVINIKKDSYTPSQTRKKINIPGSGFKEIVIHACILKIMYIIANTDSVEDIKIYNRHLPGLTYTGDAGQVQPDFSTSLYKAGRYYDGSVNVLYRYASEKFNHRNMAMVIRDLRDIISSKEQVTLENISKVAKGSDIYNKTIYRWFSSKTFTPSNVLGASDDSGLIRNVVRIDPRNNPENLIKFVAMITSRVWEYLKINMTGYKLGKVPAIILIKSVDRIDGYYDPTKHTIHVSMKKHNIEELEKESLNIMKLIDEGKNEEAALYFKNSTAITKFMGISPVTVTFVHEFGHAIRGNSHTDNNPHGDFIYHIKDRKFSYGFHKGCNQLWKLGLQNAF